MRDLYWVVNKETGKKYSKDPLPKETAKAQMKALYSSENGTHREHFLKDNSLVERGYSLRELSKISSVPLNKLQEVYNRGIGAYKTNPSSVRLKGSYVKGVNAPMKNKLSKEQWAMARVYSFLDGNPKHDNDLRGGVTISKEDFIKEHENLLGVLKRGKKSELLNEANDQSRELNKVLKGGARINPYFQQIAEAAYSDNPPHQIGNFRLTMSTPTLKFYNNDAFFAVGIRGTNLSDSKDIEADSMALVGRLKQSQRYQKDLADMKHMKQRYPQYSFVGVGHSLGGAVLDGLLRDGLLQSGVSYNGLVEPQELRGNPQHHRIYHSDDPIYKIIGWTIPNVEVVKGNQGFWGKLLKFALPFGLSTLFASYMAHRIGSI
jgi:hypothetical protein